MATPPPIPNPSDVLSELLYKFFEDYTYGFVHDVKTLFLAGGAIGLIVFGARRIFEYLEFNHASDLASASFERASGYASKRDSYSTGTAGYDYYNALYKQDIGNAVSFSKKI